MSWRYRLGVALLVTAWIAMLIVEWPWDRFLWYVAIVSAAIAAWYGIRALRSRTKRS